MPAAPALLWVAVLLLASPGLRCSSLPRACPEPCSCGPAPLLNCSSAGLSSVPRLIPRSVAELDLSRNRLGSVRFRQPHPDLRDVRLGNNQMARLSLCVDGRGGGSEGGGGPGRGCVCWAPALQLLSAEGNRLLRLPQGLKDCASLLVLQLSHNRISSLRAGDLSSLRQLKELHLHHNLISSLHPLTFQGLTELKVLDLSFNLLTSVHPSMYLSLRNMGSEVRLGGNRWRCDCNMRLLRRHLALDEERGGVRTWDIVCDSPAGLSGTELLLLEENDLKCVGTTDSRDVTVERLQQKLLSCSKQDSGLLTPSTNALVSQPSLFISAVAEKETGLYVCMNEDEKIISAFHLQISRVGRAGRKARSLHGNDIPQVREIRAQGTTQSDLALAVCLSILFTFLIAFILGVVARPCIEVLWTRVKNKRTPTATSNTVSSAEHRQYDNEGYFESEEPEEVVTHRERRVTFSSVSVRQEANVEYYDTVASENQQSTNDDGAIEIKAVRDRPMDGDSGSENGSRRRSLEDERDADNMRTHKVKFEQIPDSDEQEERRSLSSSSDSSLSDRESKENDHATHNPPQREEDSIQQRADSPSKEAKVPQITLVGTREIAEFSPGLFSDWSPREKNLPNSDLWQGNEEPFDFSDSARSSGVFNDSKLSVKPTSDIQSRDDTSSSSSQLSDDEPTQYTVNPDMEVGLNTESNLRKTDAGSEQQISSSAPVRPPRGLNQGNYPHDAQTSSSQSSESDGQRTVKPKKPNRIVAEERDARERVKPMARYSSTDESEDDTKTRTKTIDTSSSADSDPELEHTNIKKRPDIKTQSNLPDSSHSDEARLATSPGNVGMIQKKARGSDSSGSSDSEDETTGHAEKQISSEVNKSELLLKEPQTTSQGPDERWPVLDLDNIPHISRRLDIKATVAPPSLSAGRDLGERPGPASITQRSGSGSSSSSDSEDGVSEKQGQGQTHLATTSTTEGETQWPALDLQNIPHVKRRLDIKAPPPPPDPSSQVRDETTHLAKMPGQVGMTRMKTRSSDSSSSDSEDGLATKTEKQSQGKEGIPPTTVVQTAVDLHNVPRIKRRLDIKAPSPPPTLAAGRDETQLATMPGQVGMTQMKTQSSDSSSSSDSEDGLATKTEMQITQMVKPPRAAVQSAVDLQNIPHIKRRLDFKAPSPPPVSSSHRDTERPGMVVAHAQEHLSDSSSSSDSEDGLTTKTEKQIQGNMNTEKPPTTVVQTLQPAIDVQEIPHVKRQAPPPPTLSPGRDGGQVGMTQMKTQSSDSSSSSDSEDGLVNKTETQSPGRTQTVKPLTTVVQTEWPAIDVQEIPLVKRQAPPPPTLSAGRDGGGATQSATMPAQVGVKTQKTQSSDSSSSSDSEVVQTQWPAIDVQEIPRIKRRLDIKAPSPPPTLSAGRGGGGATQLATTPGQVGTTQMKTQRSDSSSSSDSEDGLTSQTEMQIQGTTQVVKPPTAAVQSQWPEVDLQNIPHIKRRLDFKAPSPPPDSSSRGVSIEQTLLGQLPGKMGITQMKTQSSGSSSSSEGEDDLRSHTERQSQGNVHLVEPPTAAVQSQWPAVDLQNIPHIKRRLDFKAPSPPPHPSSHRDNQNETLLVKRLGMVVAHPKEHGSDSSSSSDSEDGLTTKTEKQSQGKTQMAIPLTTAVQTQWPAIDMEEIPRVKRRLDIKAPSPPHSSSRGEDETTHLAQISGQVGMTQMKTQSSDSSSSSDSEDGLPTKIEMQSQGKTQMAIPPTTAVQSQWPAVDLQNIPHIKRRLDFKAPSPPPDPSSHRDTVNETLLVKRPGMVVAHPKEHGSDSSSSSDSEDGLATKTEKQSQGKTQMAIPPTTAVQTQWPAIDMEEIPRIKRRLDIKAPSPAPDPSSHRQTENETLLVKRPGMVIIADTKEHGSDSSSSSDSEDGFINKTETQSPGKTQMEIPPTTVIQTAVDLQNVPRIKRRLDIKAPSPPPTFSAGRDGGGATQLEERPGRLDITQTKTFGSGSSSNSDSEDGFTTQTQSPGMTQMAKPPTTAVQTQWPVMDLQNIPHIKRRLDFKAPSLPPDPSSLSDSKKQTLHIAEIAAPTLQSSNSLSGWRNNQTIEAKTKEANRMSPVDTSSSSDEQDQNAEDPRYQLPSIDYHVKRHLEVKGHSPPADLLVEVKKDEADVGNTNYPQATKWVMDINSSSPGFPSLDMKAPSPTDYELKRYTTDDPRNRPMNVDTPEINPDLQSRWASMSLGVSRLGRLRKRLEITSPLNASPNLPSSPAPYSPPAYSGRIIEQSHKEPNPDALLVDFSSPRADWFLDTKVKQETPTHRPSESTSSSESLSSDYKRWTGTSRPSPLPGTEEEGRESGLEPKSQTSERREGPDSMWPRQTLTNIPKVKRSLDVRVQRQPSTSSSDEDTDPFNLGVPQWSGHLNYQVAAPVREASSSSSSESETQVTGHSSNTSEDFSTIAYNRSIIKAPRETFSTSGRSRPTDPDLALDLTGHRSASLPSGKAESVRADVGFGLPPALRLTSARGFSRGLNQGGLPADPELAPRDSPGLKLGGTAPYETLAHRYPSPAGARASSALDLYGSAGKSKAEIFRALSEDTKEQRGVRALKSMSSQRLQWEAEDEFVV